ncbi:hypothetical protein [Bradyrhizobium uaiense]|uniref:Uncharacterized protein n=1 Tax=Bradyrhizobium uaiense TaxID=2594946 RepID=A0A6P1B744_9BRAD|nr:hypothetical protein [Bradyrhizobium uaiense]NEU94408.1 hypothetical protein [Bradyrhizobium uaiense]
MRRLRFHAKGRSGIRLAIHVGVLLAVGAGGEAMAKSRRHGHAHRPHRDSVHTAAVPAPVQPALHLGPMRYYGGPKSPLWRAPLEY